MGVEPLKPVGDPPSESEWQLRQAIDSIPALVWFARPDGSAEFFNQHYLDYMGLALKEAQDWGWVAVVHPDDRSRLAGYWKSILATGKQGEIEARLRRFDGEYRWFLFRANPFRDDSGNIVKWYGATVAANSYGVIALSSALAIAIPSRRSVEMSVVRGIPSLAAAPFRPPTTPLH